MKARKHVRRIRRTKVSFPLFWSVAKYLAMALYHVLALLPLLNFGDGVVFALSASNPSKYTLTISGSMSTSLTHESSTSEYPSQ